MGSRNRSRPKTEGVDGEFQLRNLSDFEHLLLLLLLAFLSSDVRERVDQRNLGVCLFIFLVNRGEYADVVTYVVTSGHDSVRNVLLDVVSTPSRWRTNVSFINVVFCGIEPLFCLE